MANPQNDNFILRGKKTLDARRLRLDGTPWTSVLEVNNAFIDNDRVESQVYFIVDREYWYLGGTENENLVEKKAGTTYEDSGTIEFTETTAEVKDNSLDLVKLKEISQHSFLARTDSGDGPVEEVTLDIAQDLLGIITLEANVDTLKTDKADKSTTYTKTEVDNLDTAIINLLRNGVSSEGDTLNKLYNLILGASGQVTKANITERNAYNVPLGGQVFVLDDGDGKWALYKATTAGVGATYVKLSDPDLLNAVMTGAMIKVAYSAEPNAFNDALKITYDNAVTAINSVVTQLSTYLVDNLSSNATDKALTAKQGKVLDDKITVLTNAISTINTALANIYTKTEVNNLVKGLTRSNIRQVNGSYTLEDQYSGKDTFIKGNSRTINLPNDFTGVLEGYVETFIMLGTGGLLTNADALPVIGLPTGVTFPIALAQFSSVRITRTNFDGVIAFYIDGDII